MKKGLFLFILTTFLFIPINIISDTFYEDLLSKEKLKLLPITNDYRNYFFFHSINEESQILIGDFTGIERMIIQIKDKNCDNTIDKVVEYFPDRKQFREGKSTNSKLFSNLKKMKEEIISGVIFKVANYAYKMKSIDTIKYVIKKGTNFSKHKYGYSVKFIDPDTRSTIMSEFFFGKEHGRYNLIFKTKYYRLYKLKIVPPIEYSVFCRNSKDPIVAKTVEALLKIVGK